MSRGRKRDRKNNVEGVKSVKNQTTITEYK